MQGAILDILEQQELQQQQQPDRIEEFNLNTPSDSTRSR